MRCSQWCFLLLVLILEIVASCDWDDCDEGMSLRQLRGQKTSQAQWPFSDRWRPKKLVSRNVQSNMI